jgi:hypothetical protein
MNRSLVLVLCLPAFAAACATPPPAATRAAPELVAAYDAAVIEGVATELGYTIQSRAGAGEDGGPNVRVRTAARTEFGVFGVSCRGEGETRQCDGVQLVSSFDIPASPEFDVDAFVPEVNTTFSVAKMVRLEDRLTLSRYLIMDHGISRQNLKVNLQVFEEVLGYVTGALPE